MPHHAAHTPTTLAPLKAQFEQRKLLKAGAAVSLWCLALMSGCVGPEIALSAGLNAVSANSATFSKGELISATRSPLAQTHEAVKRAFVALGLTPRNERLRDTTAYVMAVSLDERDITVRLSSVAPSVTSISVKAGFWGDAALSRLVQDQIDVELKIAAIAPEPAK